VRQPANHNDKNYYYYYYYYLFANKGRQDRQTDMYLDKKKKEKTHIKDNRTIISYEHICKNLTECSQWQCTED